MNFGIDLGLNRGEYRGMENGEFDYLPGESNRGVTARMLIHIELGLTFLDSADTTTYEVVRERHISQAQQAHDTVMTLANSIKSDTHLAAISGKLTELQERLVRANGRAKAAGA